VGSTQGYANGGSLAAKMARPTGYYPHATTGGYIADAQNHSIRSWDGTNVTTFAGNGTAGFVNGFRTSARFNVPTRVTEDSSGNDYVVDMGNNAIRKIDSAGNVTTLAGTGVRGYVNGAGATAQFSMPTSIRFDPTTNALYVTDSMNNAIRKITLAGQVTTYAGAQQGGYVNG
jgi:hypothetical protein